jgi:PAS domain S-box-containing protein
MNSAIGPGAPGHRRVPWLSITRHGAPGFVPPVLVAIFAAAIFLVNAVLPWGIAIDILYVVVILLAAPFLHRTGILLVAAGCIGLTVMGDLLDYQQTLSATKNGHHLVAVVAFVFTALLAARNEEATALTQARANLLDLTHDAVLVRNPDGIVTFWNDGAVALYGWSHDEALGKRLHELIGTRFPQPQQQIEAALNASGRWEGNLRCTRRDGSPVEVASRWALQRVDPGRPGATIETHTDITERKDTQTSLRSSDDEFRAAIDAIPILAWRARADGSANFCNQQFLNYTGLAIEDAMDWGWTGALHPDDVSSLLGIWKAALAEIRPREAEARLRRFDGVFRWFLFRAAPALDAKGNLLSWYGTSLDIEDRKRAETDLRALIDAIPTHIWTLHPDGSANYFNRRRLDYTGPDVGFMGIIHPDDRPTHDNAWSIALPAGTSFQSDLRLKAADGTYRWFLCRSEPLKDNAGRIVSWVGMSTDIDDLRRAERLIREAESNLRTAIDTIPAHIWVYHPDGSGDLFNRRRLDYTGPDVDLMAVIHPDDRLNYDAKWAIALATSDSFQIEGRLRRFDGTYRWFLTRAEPLRDTEGRVAKWFGTNTDIDDLRRAEQQIREAESTMRATIDTIPTHIWSLRRDGTADFFNRRRLEYTGPGVDFLAIVHPDDRPAHDDQWANALATGSPIQHEVRLRRFDGTYRWFLAHGEPQRDAEGRIVKWFGTNTDIDDQKRAEDALRRSETYLADAQRLSQTGTLAWREDGSWTFWSDETYRIFDYERSIDPSMERVFDRIHPDDIAGLRHRLERAPHAAPDMSADLRIVTANGVVKHLRILARPMTPTEGENEFIGAVTDITAARRAEEALQRAQAELAHVTRVATMGELTASIAHEVNQPLAGIVTNGEACLRWLRRDAPDLQEAERAVERMVGDGRRAGEVVRRLRALARKDEPRRLPLDLNEVVQESLALIRQEFSRRRIVLDLELSPELPPVLGDRVQLQQVVINLIVNGIQAMADIADRPSVLTISSRMEEAEAGAVDEVTLTVRDTGPGINPPSSAHLFDAFFTTRTDGMGMGLSICRSIIEAHGGRIWLLANSEAGAVFQFMLPVHRSVFH